MCDTEAASEHKCTRAKASRVRQSHEHNEVCTIIDGVVLFVLITSIKKSKLV